MFNVIRELWWFIRKNWYLYILILVVGIINIVILLIPTQIIGDFSGKLKDDALTKDYLIKNIIVALLAINVVIFFVSTTKRILQNRLKVKLYYALQVKYIENIIIQDAGFFENFQSGDLLTRALGDVKSVNFSGSNRLLNIFLEFLTIVAVFIVMFFFINWKMTLSAVGPLFLIFVINMILRSKVKRNWRNVREASSGMGNVVLESITNVRTIRAFSKEEENYQKNINHSNEVYRIEKRNLKINVLFQPIFQSIVAISIIITYYMGSRLIVNGDMEFSDLIKFTLYLGMFAGPLTSIGNMIMNFYQSLISLDRLNEIFYAKCAVENVKGAIDIKGIDRIEFKNLSFKYPQDNLNVLNNINLDIKKGETIGIVGKTGSGKSTLVRQLVRQFPIKLGELLINGENINTYTKESVRSMVSYVPQEHILFSRSVLRNVALGSINHVSDFEIDEAMDKADFKKDIENLPYGLETIVGEYGVTLSGGQKQRLAIARALLKDSDVLILDDSLSAVDGKTEANIIANLKKHRAKKTNIIVAHRLSAVMHADHIIVLDNGQIVESGNHENLMKYGGWYHKLFLEQLMDDSEAGDLNE